MAVAPAVVLYSPESTIRCHSSRRTIVLSCPQCHCFLLVQCCVLPLGSLWHSVLFVHICSMCLSLVFLCSFLCFVSSIASSEWIAEADRTVVIAIESFSSILSFSFVIGVVTVVSVAAVSSVAFAFVLSFSFAFSFVTVVLAFSFVDCINVHGCLSTPEACCHAG